MTNPIKTQPKDTRPALSVSEFLWLQQEKRRFTELETTLTHLQHRQDRQSAWIALLLLTVVVLAAGLVFVLTV